MSESSASEKIQAYLKEMMLKNKGDFHTPLPSEYFLATKFKVSRQTARKQLLNFLNKGLIVAKRGSGYFVNPNIDYVAIQAIGDDDDEWEKELTEINNDRFDEFTHIVGLKLNTNDYMGYKKIYRKDDEYIQITSYIKKILFPEINLERIKNSLLSFIAENEINIEMQLNKIKFEYPTSTEAKIFGIDESEKIPVFYGALLTKENEVIEVFERKVVEKDFEYSFVKRL